MGFVGKSVDFEAYIMGNVTSSSPVLHANFYQHH